MNKRGQITPWIIIGLLIVIVAGLIFMYWGNLRQSYVEYRNPEAKAVRLFVEECLEEVSEEALRFASLQGGYVEVPADIIYSNPLQPAFLPPPYPDGSLPPYQTPLWWYKGRNRMPSLVDIENNIGNFVKDNINTCLRDFEQFDNVFAESFVTTDVTLGNSVMSIIYDRPLRIEEEDRIDSITSFGVDVPTQIRRMYELAKDIHEFEDEETFLETVTVDLLANTRGGEEISIPFEGFEFDCNRKVWSVQFDIIPSLQQLLKYNLKYVSFDNTIPNYDDDHEINREVEWEVCDELDDRGLCISSSTQRGELFDYYKDRYRFDATNSNYDDVRVRLTYDKTFYMEVNVEPSSGDLVKPATMDVPIIGSCMNLYALKYDIEYPLMITLESDDGEIFNFATSVKIQRNEPRRFYSPYVQHEYIEDGLLKEGEYYYNPSSEEYCSEVAFTKDVVVKDEVTNRNIEGANVQYECVQFTCDLGETARPTFDGVPISGTVPFLRGGFPECTNGFVSANKDGYRENSVQVDIGTGSSIPVIELTPLKKLNITAYKIQKVGTSVSINQLDEDEKVFVSVYNRDENYDDIVFYPAIEYDPFLDLINKDLSYTFDAKLIRDGKPVGGLYLEDWRVNRNSLDAANEIRVYVLESTSDIESLDDYKIFWESVIKAQSADHMPILR